MKEEREEGSVRWVSNAWEPEDCWRENEARPEMTDNNQARLLFGSQGIGRKSIFGIFTIVLSRTGVKKSSSNH